ncbi:MAG: TIGR01777 family protein [Rubrobacter sp.]|nr:TIGR01777 family protein [Rubrobacter sp.]
MKVLVSGATGMVGTALSEELRGAGHTVTTLSRSKPSSEDTVRWDPSRRSVDSSRLEGHDAVVHLAGESIVGSNPVTDRWTPQKKARIMESRRQGTTFLSETLAKLTDKPKVLVSASAVGYYGDRGNELLREDSGPGSDFLAEVCKVWESSADAAREAGIRVVHPRIGIVLSTEGGALGTTLPIFKLGGGGKVGSGNQFWSWVALDDLIGSIRHSIENDSVIGPVNVGSPNPVTNAEYTKVLGEVLGRPTFLPLPAAAARIMLGEVADALLLASARMEPTKLEATNYEFRHPELEGALRRILGK